MLSENCGKDRRRISRIAVALACLLGAVGGCVTTVEKSGGSFGARTVTVNGQQQPDAGTLVTPPPKAQQQESQVVQPKAVGKPIGFEDISKGNDACAARMQDMCGSLILYYATKKHLPERLDELSSFNIGGSPLQFVCPTSNQPYSYDPNGPMLGNSVWLVNDVGQTVNLGESVSVGQMVVYDTTPAHNGQRWVIVFGRDRSGTTPVAQPYLIPEKTFQEAIKAPRQSAPVK
ncbi:MAG TPA: hypothetical protein VH370_11490 [Humisphaera sp.]|nr:hypothetical protein [Humisphaera sp.]